MKEIIINFLYWALEKLDKGGIESAEINLVTTVDFRKIVPKDGKWHNIGFTTTAWIMREKNGKELKFDSVDVYKDGKDLMFGVYGLSSPDIPKQKRVANNKWKIK